MPRTATRSPDSRGQPGIRRLLYEDRKFPRHPFLRRIRVPFCFKNGSGSGDEGPGVFQARSEKFDHVVFPASERLEGYGSSGLI